ncbi:MAG TPA: RNA-binding protein [Lactococcus sp.]|uniref:S1 RNA-binding domain-containing protein n=1 Tax=Lactococcus muris TaxID=2941330 RepID=A0ABV4D7B8_9LACT|nr:MULTISPECIES: S1 RNA-binding domain-containing protein [Lactococcus]HAP14743.1 RNA-binding protein [Lactococcus sp.]HBC90627.1 RNA-binding protein [Lactococcus sp.]
MIGKVKSISKFGLFVLFSDKKTGLLRWSNIPRRQGKYKVGDLIGVEILQAREDGKYELKFIEKDFEESFGHFLGEATDRLKSLKTKNEFLKRL